MRIVFTLLVLSLFIIGCSTIIGFTVSKDCKVNDDCTLLYNSCTCIAANKYQDLEGKDRAVPSSNLLCIVNNCHSQNITAICSDSKCVISDE